MRNPKNKSNANDGLPSPVHPLRHLASEVESTHPGLGRLTAMCWLATVARKTLLIIAPAGTGKSTATNLVNDRWPGAWRIAALTEAGLDPLQEQFNGFKGCLILDDLGRLQTSYRRINTIATLTELVYSHFAEDHTGHQHLTIENFQGSAIINCQPGVMADLIGDGVWDATVQDKTTRYYHLRRPLMPNLEALDLEMPMAEGLKDVETPSPNEKLTKQLIHLGYFQWGAARSREHITDYLKAMAAFRNDTIVNTADVLALDWVLRPCWFEDIATDREYLDAKRKLDVNLIYLATQWITYGGITYADLIKDYKVSYTTARRIMASQRKQFDQDSKDPPSFHPLPELRNFLEKIS